MTKKETNEVAILEIKKEFSPIIFKATKVEIKDEKSLTNAAEILSQINLANDNVTKKLKSITKPQKEAIEAAEAIFKPFMNECKSAIAVIRGKMADYQTEQVRLQRIEEEKIAARIGEGKGKIKFETAVTKMDAIDKAPSKVTAVSGSVNFITTKKLKITDETKIPREFLIVNESKLLAALKGGMIVKGAEIVEIQSPRNNR